MQLTSSAHVVNFIGTCSYLRKKSTIRPVTMTDFTSHILQWFPKMLYSFVLLFLIRLADERYSLFRLCLAVSVCK